MRDPVVLLVEDPIIDPAAPGCLQQRMAQHQDEAAAGLEHACDLPDRGSVVVDVLERGADHDRVERAGTAGQGLGASVGVPRSTGPRTSDGDL